MKLKPIATVLMVGILGVVLLSCKRESHESSQPTPPNKPESVSLRLAWLPGATFAGDYVALNKGYWKDEGLDVTVNPGGFESDAIKLVASGADTFGVTSGPQLLQARASGVPVVAIGATIPRSPIGWIAKKSSGIKTPQDFVGKKVGAEYGTHTEITFEALCGKLGIATSTIQRIPVKFDPRPFVAGEIDVLPVYIIDQPIDLREQGLELNVIDPGDYGVALSFGNLYFTTEETVQKSPDLIRHFLEGARKGWMEVKSNPDEAVQILAGFAPDSKTNVLKEKIDVTLAFIAKTQPEYKGVFPMSLDAWESTKQIMTKYGNLPPATSVTNAFTNDLLPK